MEKRERKRGQQKSAIHAIFMENLPRQENREPGKDNTTYSCVLGSVL